MPIYEFYNEEENEVIEEIFSFNDRPEEIQRNNKTYVRIISIPARTEYLWGKTLGSNMKGEWNPGLGRYVKNYQHQDQIMKEMDVRPITLNEGLDQIDKNNNQRAQAKKDIATHRKKLGNLHKGRGYVE